MIVIVLIFLISSSLARLPTQPPSFNAASPFMAWTFRQSDCVARSVPDDVGNALSFSLNTNAGCPSRTSGASFNNAAIGGTVTNSLSRAAAIETPVVGTRFSSFQALNKEWSFAMVVTPGDRSTCDTFLCHLIEFGPSTGTKNVVSAPPNGNYFEMFLDATLSNAYSITVQLQTDAIRATTYTLAFSDTDFYAAGKPYFIGFTISATSVLDLNFYLGQVGTTPAKSSGGCGASANCTLGKTWLFPSDSNFLLGSTRSFTNGHVGLQGDFHLVGFYNRSLTQTEMNQLATALPNSVPAVRTDGTPFNLTQSTQQQQVNLAASSSYFDFDSNTATKFKILTQPTKGNLFKNTILQNSFPVIVSATDNITYLGNNGESSSFNCTVPQAEAYATFTYQITDGKGDGSVDCSSTVDSTCLSVSAATGYICVVETNSAPQVTTATTTKTVLTETNTTSAITLSCGDSNKNPNYQLSYIRLVSHDTTLGAFFYNPSGLCNGTLADFSNSNQPVFPISGQSNSISLCYIAFKAAQAQTVVGVDTLRYMCTDLTGANSTTATVAITVQNALQAGCGSFPFGSTQTCTSYGIEDVGVNVTLSGTDAAATHVGKNLNRRYRIDSLPDPSLGILYNSSASNAVAVTQGSIFPATDNLTGTLKLFFRPSTNFFNALCDLNTDPPTSLNCPNKRYTDGLGRNLFPAITFDYTLGFDDGSGPVPVFGQKFVGGATVYVYGVNDGPTALIAPPYLTGLISGNSYPIGSYYTNTSFSYYEPRTNTYISVTNSSMSYFDPDGDTYRVGFTIKITNTSGSLSNPTYQNSDLVSEGGNSYGRKTMIFGESCAETGGGGCYFSGKAYMSDLNSLMRGLVISPGANSNGDAVSIQINDPVNFPNEFNPSDSNTPLTTAVTASTNIAMSFSNGNNNPPSSVSITAGIWAGIAAAGIFVILSCFACWSCIINRAREGEKAALWLVRNVICTDVEQVEKKQDLRAAAAGGRKSLEAAIHKEHQRLAQVYCCALFMKKVFPCCVKFDPKGMDIPDEEALMQVALDEEAHKLALKHRPDDKTVRIDIEAGDQVRIEGDVIDIISEDILADDSIFDWEKHVDEGTGRVFYYNSKTHESRWTPPTVKVHEQHKIADRTSVKDAYSPKPPEYPNPNKKDQDTAGSERVYEPHPPDMPKPGQVTKN